MSAVDVVNEILGIYRSVGYTEYDGEPVSHLEHMLQAAQLAMDEGFDDEVILAAFLHDIGHIAVERNEQSKMMGYGIVHHEKTGADFLRVRGFPEKICQLVEHHVTAKRYLVYSEPEYFQSLSEASRETLRHQGGPMKAEEAQAFERHPYFTLFVRMRRWDDQAKQVNGRMADLNIIRDM
ncbi:MAG: HD domain-containing protein, partial [Cyclobacteriaceae bacterium]|nr:HD domain-containing protein [Cyclobacteriaceae bacterium]